MPDSCNGEYSLDAEWMNEKVSEWENELLSLSDTDNPLKVGNSLLPDIRVLKGASPFKKILIFPFAYY